ncbi:MAG: hypothetical protein Q7R49_02440 [Candidatus Daviesbacteria bacterium]|nr:hypothetical protein [Candidatus Daviesbacteria bacterium]
MTQPEDGQTPIDLALGIQEIFHPTPHIKTKEEIMDEARKAETELELRRRQNRETNDNLRVTAERLGLQTVFSEAKDILSQTGLSANFHETWGSSLGEDEKMSDDKSYSRYRIELSWGRLLRRQDQSTTSPGSTYTDAILSMNHLGVIRDFEVGIRRGPRRYSTWEISELYLNHEKLKKDLLEGIAHPMVHTESHYSSFKPAPGPTDDSRFHGGG